MRDKQPGQLQSRITQGLARRLARWLPGPSARALRQPVFIVGFNNCGKSTVVRLLRQQISELLIYPGEGNGELWFPGFFPWIASDVDVGPIWLDPEAFLNEVSAARNDEFLSARAQLGAFQYLNGGRTIVNDSGMLAALAPEILSKFPDARFIHFVRDGRLSAYITAHLEWSRIIRSPGKYLEFSCPLDFSGVLERMAAYWAWTMERMEIVSSGAPGRVIQLRYEDWWHEPETAVSQIAAFLNVSPSGDANALNPLIDLTPRIREEMTAVEISIIEKVAAGALGKLGYTRRDSGCAKSTATCSEV